MADPTWEETASIARDAILEGRKDAVMPPIKLDVAAVMASVRRTISSGGTVEDDGSIAAAFALVAAIVAKKNAVPLIDDNYDRTTGMRIRILSTEDHTSAVRALLMVDLADLDDEELEARLRFERRQYVPARVNLAEAEIARRRERAR